MKTLDPMLLILVAAALGLAFRFQFFLRDRFSSDTAKLVIDLAELILSVLVEVLLLSVFLSAAGLEQAFRPSAAAVLIGNSITAVRLLLRFLLRKKRHLTQQQKAELMDL